MYIEPSNRFILSAKREGNTFYISQYETFPEVKNYYGCQFVVFHVYIFPQETDGVPNARYCCVLRYDKPSKQYKLFLCGCEDESIYYNLEKHACTTDEQHIDGQLLAEISHGVKHISQVDAEMRAMKVAIPAVMDVAHPTVSSGSPRTPTRAIWCPRADMLRDAYDKSHSGIRSSNDYSSRNSSSSSVSRNKDSRSSGGAEGKEKEPPSSTGTLELETKLPEWNNDIYTKPRTQIQWCASFSGIS